MKLRNAIINQERFTDAEEIQKVERKNVPTSFNLNTGTDLAFALVVFIAFFSAFRTSPVNSLVMILVIIVLGIAYITNGIYGFSYVRTTKSGAIKVLYFFSQLIISGLISYFGKGAGFSALIMLPLVAHAVIALDQNWSIIVTIGVLVSYITVIWSYSHDFQLITKALPIFFIGLIVVLIFTQMAVNENKARKKLETLAQELSEANRHLSEYAEQVHDFAITQERNRFAREIHDGLGHYLTTISMQINAADALISNNPQKAGAMLKKAKEMTSQALVDVRDSVFALRKDAISLDDLPGRIRQLVEDSWNPDMVISLHIEGQPVILSPQANLTLYRTAQETLNNAQKYSNAGRVELKLDYSQPGVVVLEVRDDGQGAEEVHSGFGLLGIQERARLLNGEVNIINHSGEGFEVRISIPIS